MQVFPYKFRIIFGNLNNIFKKKNYRNKQILSQNIHAEQCLHGFYRCYFYNPNNHHIATTSSQSPYIKATILMYKYIYTLIPI